MECPGKTLATAENSNLTDPNNDLMIRQIIDGLEVCPRIETIAFAFKNARFEWVEFREGLDVEP